MGRTVASIAGDSARSLQGLTSSPTSDSSQPLQRIASLERVRATLQSSEALQQLYPVSQSPAQQYRATQSSGSSIRTVAGGVPIAAAREEWAQHHTIFCLNDNSKVEACNNGASASVLPSRPLRACLGPPRQTHTGSDSKLSLGSVMRKLSGPPRSPSLECRPQVSSPAIRYRNERIQTSPGPSYRLLSHTPVVGSLSNSVAGNAAQLNSSG